jgi:Flp pilus assembly protein TadG
MTMQHRRNADQGDERGNATIMVIILVTSLLLVMGLVVDGSRHYRANDEARWLAEQAARVAAQQIDASNVQNGDRPRIDYGPASTAARNLVTDAGGTMTAFEPAADGTIRVVVRTTATPILMKAFGVAELTGNGAATVRLARGIEDGNA